MLAKLWTWFKSLFMSAEARAKAGVQAAEAKAKASMQSVETRMGIRKPQGGGGPGEEDTTK